MSEGRGRSYSDGTAAGSKSRVIYYIKLAVELFAQLILMENKHALLSDATCSASNCTYVRKDGRTKQSVEVASRLKKSVHNVIT